MAADEIHFNHSADIGPNGRRANFTVVAKLARPDWYIVHMHADYIASQDFSTSDVLATVRELRDAWIVEVTARFS